MSEPTTEQEAGPAPASLQAHIDPLRELRVQLLAEHEAAQARVTVAADALRRVDRALAALAGTPIAAVPRDRTVMRSRLGTRRKLWRALEEDQAHPTSVLAERSGMSIDASLRAVKEFVEEGRARRVAPHGTGWTYARMPNQKGPPMSLPDLKLDSFSDRELLLVIADLAGDGWVTSAAVADHLGVQGEQPKHAASSRMSWLVRYGALERELLFDEKGIPLTTRSGNLRYGQGWKLTDIGQALANGTLSTPQRRALRELTDEQTLLATRAIAERRSANPTVNQLMRREWRYSTSPNRD